MYNLENDEQFLSGGGQMGALIRSMDWSKTALGPVSDWPQSLRTSVSLCLSSTFPILIAWGPELIQIYNDSYRPICGAKHPESMGQNFKICWETALPVVGDAFDRGLAGEGTYIKDQQMLLDRYGYLEEAFMTFSFAPIRDESGNVGGIFHPITETTEQILSARRTQVLRDMSAHTANAKSFEEIYHLLAEIFPKFSYDVPFVQIYELSDDEKTATLKITSGIQEQHIDFPVIELSADNAARWPFEINTENTNPIEVNELQLRFGNFHSGPFDHAPHTALIYPVSIAGNDKLLGFLVVGVSAVRALDQAYQNFFDLFANTVITAFSNVDAYLQQQKRAQQLAEIDSAKTAFFSNVSHEFRTPLTLILGPLQQLMDNPASDGKLSVANRDSMYRNAQRLLKLVNNLLDFSRMEAGRVKAVYQPVDLPTLTADLASNFRSVIEAAGMELRIDAKPFRSEVYVDADMWEKIVLNLLSNAFKYTLQGSIVIAIEEIGDEAVLSVTDTGIGIPENELPHMFERFHRVENAVGRTHEGTGIGLSLVAELVNLHHGKISLSSVFGAGSTFKIHIPLGSKHLPADQIEANPGKRILSSQKETFIREAMSLLDREEEAGELLPVTGGAADDLTFEIQKAVRVLVVDDNADMRAYLGKLLSAYFTVDLAINGLDGLEKAAEINPDVIVSDVMMPVMDGQQMLRALRDRPGARIPVILLSARAGEESRVEGLGWGADDYLVKPFSAKELISKVTSVVKINKVARKTESELRNILLRAPVAIGIFRGPELVIDLANNMLLRYWGKTVADVIGLPFSEAFEAMPEDGFDALAREVLQTGERKVLREWALDITRKGKPAQLFVNLAFEPLRDISGLLTSVMVVANDITEQVTALGLVRESEQRFKLLSNSMQHLIWRIDQTGGDNFYNDFTLKYLGVEIAALRKTGLIAFVHPDEKAQNLIAWQKSLASGEDFTYEHRYRRHDGQYRWHLSRGSAQRNDAGKIETWIGYSTDIHDQKMLEETLEKRVALRTTELESMNEQLLNTNRELEQFAHVTSHDLQEPLRKIQVFAGLIREKVSESDEDIQNYLHRIRSSSERMSLLIRDLLSFARTTNKDVVFEPTDLNQIWEQVKADFDIMIDQKNARIVSGALPVIDAVPLQMNQLFYNLLGNALKFSTEEVFVEIKYQHIPASELTRYAFLKPFVNYAMLSVTDHGMGFDQHYADRIFTIFQRLNNRSNFEGTGIGLSICKRIVENHGGYIRARSAKGEGATFEVFLPVEHRKADD